MEYRLIAFIEKEVENAHIGQETVFLLIYLIISMWDEFGIAERLFRPNHITKIH